MGALNTEIAFAVWDSRLSIATRVHRPAEAAAGIVKRSQSFSCNLVDRRRPVLLPMDDSILLLVYTMSIRGPDIGSQTSQARDEVIADCDREP